MLEKAGTTGERIFYRSEGGLTLDWRKQCVYVRVFVCLETAMSDRADEVVRLAGAVCLCPISNQRLSGIKALWCLREGGI